MKYKIRGILSVMNTNPILDIYNNKKKQEYIRNP